VFVLPPTGVNNPTVTNATGAYATAYPGGAYISTSSTNNPGLLIVNIPAGGVAGDRFTISNVRVQISGTGISNLAASISTVGNAILGGQTNPTVVTSVANGIGTVTLPSSGGGPISLNAVTGLATGGNPATLRVKENFLSAFAPGTGVKIVLSKAPPAGTTLQFAGTATTDAAGTTWAIGDSAGTTTGTAANVTSASTNLNVYYYYVTSATAGDNNTVLETLTVTITESGTPTSSQLPLDLTPVSVQVSLAPISSALTSGGAGKSTPTPRYDELLVAGPTIVTISGSRTALMAEYVTVGSGFDTGIAITNTTEDPGATALGGGGAAVAQAGTITFYFFPATGTNPTSYVTSSTSPNNTMLDSSGRVPAGGTYKILLSQLLAAVGGPETFDGYVIAVCNFTHAHGMYVLSNFTTWGQSATFRVLEARAVPEK